MWNPLKWGAKRLQIALVAGAILGCTVPMAAMAVESRSSEAAVAVFDQRNIEEAVKTAIQTANILTTEQKELALKILDAKKLDMGMLGDIMSKNKQTQVWSEEGMNTLPEDLYKNGQVPGILNRNTKAVEILRGQIGTIEDAMSGKKTLVDLYLSTQKNHKALDASYREAAERAQASQKISQNTNEVVNAAVEAANNAEGEQQILQAQVQLLAAGILQQGDMRDILAESVALQAQQGYVQNYERAVQETRSQAYAQNFASFANK